MASKSPSGKASSKQKTPSKPPAVKKPLAQKKPTSVAKKPVPAVKKTPPTKKIPASTAKTPAPSVKPAIPNKPVAAVKALVPAPQAPAAKAMPVSSAVSAPILSEVPPATALSKASASTSFEPSFEATPAAGITLPALPPLTLSVQTSAANAATGNSHPVNILVVITSGGWPVTDLLEDHFTLMQHFEVPGKMTSFSNNIVSFRNAGSGAYMLQTRPNGGAPWVGGHLLGQLLVSSADDRQGQAAFKLIIR